MGHSLEMVSRKPLILPLSMSPTSLAAGDKQNLSINGNPDQTV